MSSAEALGATLLNNLVQYGQAKEALRGSLDELAKLSPEEGEVALSARVGSACAVHLAARSGSAWALRDLLRVRPALVTGRTSGSHRFTALHNAAESSFDGASECVELLLDAGADVEAAEADGSTALHLAANAGNESPLRLLLSRGARTEVRATGRGGNSALHDAVFKGHVGCIKALVEFAADVSAMDTVRGHTPLHVGAYFAPADAVQALVDARADVDQATDNGITALMAAACAGRSDNVAVLLNAGADLAAHDFDGLSALHWGAVFMAKGDAPACLEMILCAGVSPAAVSNSQETPLDVACRLGHAAAAAPLLLAFGSPLPSNEDELAAAQIALPAAVAIAQRQLDALQAPSTLSDAAALLEARLSAAIGSGGSECPLARLRVLRSGALPWQQTWKHMPLGQRRSRFGGTVDRLARAQAVLACAEKAEPAAAERFVAVLRQVCEAPRGEREREKLTYAAAVCVGKWADMAQEAVVEARRELAAAEAGVAAARAKGEETLARLRGWQQQDEGAE